MTQRGLGKMESRRGGRGASRGDSSVQFYSHRAWVVPAVLSSSIRGQVRKQGGQFEEALGMGGGLCGQ